MTEHEFTLVLDIPSEVSDETLETIYSQLNDCTFSQRSGASYLEFSREGNTLEEAILSAINSVCRLGIPVRRIDVCTLVTQVEIARRSNLTRQAINNYVTGRRQQGFPSPVCHLHDEENAALWSWCDVAKWLTEENLISEHVAHDAFVIDIINTQLDRQFQKKKMTETYRRVEELFDDCECCQ